MTQPQSGLLSLEEERHTIVQLARDDYIAQKTLQVLEGELRNGRYPADSRKLREAVIQCVQRNNLRVKRWALNVLTELGIAGQFDVLDEVFPHTSDDPDLLASAVRLLFREAREGAGLSLLNKQGVAVEGLALIAGSEYSALLEKRLVEERVPLDDATPEELRAAIVLTGRGRAPEHIFFARFKNDVALSELNQHDEPTVVKYSLWAMAERNLGFGYLKINLAEYDSCPAQVRKWILRLLFSDEVALSQNLDLIWHGAQDGAVEVREEAAIGLRQCYVEAAVSDIIRWYNNEPADLVKVCLIDHMASFAFREARYEELVTRIYGGEQYRSELRGRIEACVAGTEIFKKLRTVELKEEVVNLFTNDNDMDGVLMPKIEQNFPNANIGGVTGTGNVNVGGQIIDQSGVSGAQLAQVIEKLMAFANQLPDETAAAEGKQLAVDLKAKPSKSSFQKLIGWTKTATSGLHAGSGLITAGGELVHDLDSLSNMFS